MDNHAKALLLFATTLALGACPDEALPCAGRCLRAISEEECPPNLNLPNCDDSGLGLIDYCEADGECGTGNLE